MSGAGSERSRELRLDAIRREAEDKGRLEVPGIRPRGSPMPIASPKTGYYGQPLLKQPQWTPLIPFYFFVGGATGSLGVIGSLADLIGNERELACTARWMATGGSALSGALLIADLGRPKRFLNMLRVFKPQSTMSMGSWIFSGFSVSAAASSFADAVRAVGASGLLIRLMSAVGRTGTVLFGIPFHNYTGVLLGTTAIPVWNSYVKSLPREFGMSGLQAAASLLELAGYENRSSLNVLGLLSAGAESAESISAMGKKREVSKPLKQGRSGFLVTAGAILSGPVPFALRVASMLADDKRSRALRKMAAWSGIMGSLCFRYGWVAAGSASARDWRLPLEIKK